MKFGEYSKDDIINHAPRNIHEDINIEICKRLRSYNFRLATDKCHINVTSGIFLGMNFDVKKGLSIPVERLEAILNLPTKIRFYGDNIPGFPLYAQNIYKMIDKKPFNKELVNLEFKSLLEKTAKAITLECIDKSCVSITIVVAAKEESLVYVMLCNYESEKKPIMVGGRQLRTHQKNYKECTKIILALREAIYSNLEICSRYEIICKSNVKGLEKSNGIIPLTAFNTHQRLLIELSPFQIKFQFTDTNKDLVSEICNTKFSRSTTVIEESYQALEIAELLPFSSSELKESYKNDRDANLILDMLLDVKTKKEIKMKLASSFRKFLDSMELVNEIIFINKKLFITRELSSKLMLFLHKEHDSAYAMQLKANKYCIMAVNNRLAKEIYESCNICNNLRRNKTRTVDSWPSTDSSHERFHADVDEINKTKFLCITDVHSGFIMVETLKTEKSLEIINKYRSIFRLYGKPTLLVSDNARYFCAEETIQFLESINVCPIFSIPRCPQSNGCGEKSVGLVKLKAQKLIDDGMKTVEAVEKAAIILQDRITKNEKTVKEIFFGIEINIKDVLDKHNFKPKPMSIECLFKVDRSDKQWRAGIAIEQIGKNIFRIESQGRIFIRKSDSINFTKEGRIVNIDKIWCKDNEVVSNKSTEMSISGTSNNLDESCQIRESLERSDTLNNFDESLQFSKTLEKDDLLGLTHTMEQEDIDLNQYCIETEEEYQHFLKNGEFKIECGIDGSAYQGVGSAFILKSSYYNINTISGMKGNSNDSAQQAEVTALTLALEEIHLLIYGKTITKMNQF
uniref:Integrase catalytic domain-containing protein n=1 Tax=Strongyloides venezuelensis TaxID=75913 RepID=A0A0K0G1B2_STRVS